MATTFTQIFIHMVFSTKHREPLIQEEDLPKLHDFIGKTLENIGCVPIIAGGIENHVHVLFGLNKNQTVVQVARTIKANSSRWLKEQNERYNSFSWQDGYGAFSVSKSVVDSVYHYIANQEAHHHGITYEQEIEDFLRKQDLDNIDRTYLFD